MIDQGVDVLTCHVDSPKVVMETAEKRGVFCSGYHANQATLAPKGYITGAEWDWTSCRAFDRCGNDSRWQNVNERRNLAFGARWFEGWFL